MAPQEHQFPGKTYRQAGDRRREYEERCVRAGAIAHRGKAKWERSASGGVTVTTEYDFTDLTGQATAEAEGAGIVEYWAYQTVLYPRDL